MRQLSQLEEALRQAIHHGRWDSQIKSSLQRSIGREDTMRVMAAFELQPKARKKLGNGIWWCTSRSLAQATPKPVAQMKARWVDGTPTLDLCCGIGSDAIAMAQTNLAVGQQVLAVDRDEQLLEMARENCRLNAPAGEGGIEFRCADVQQLEYSQTMAAHLDPDRRAGAQRTTRPEDYSPSWSCVQQIVQRLRGAVIKIAPAAEVDGAEVDGAEVDGAEPYHRIWVSYQSSVREQTLLYGDSIGRASDDLSMKLQPGDVSALILRDEKPVTVFSPAKSDSRCHVTNEPGQWMIDPDPAIRAAGLTATFAEQFSLMAIGGPAGFLTGAQCVDENLAVSERVIWKGSCDDRKLRKTLRSINGYPCRVKTRAVSQDANRLERRYRECGEKPVTLWIGKGVRSQYAAITVAS